MVTAMYDEPYLESCCRSALHRLVLAGAAGRPEAPGEGLKDTRCLARLAELGLARREDGQMLPTEAGLARHRQEVLHQTGADAPAMPSGR
jgi:hypothetical protein